MLETMARNWWIVLVQGICAVLFGLLAIIWPGLTIGVLVLLFGAYALVDGVTEILAAIFGPERIAMSDMGTPRWMRVITGVLGIIAGIVTFAHPGWSATALLLIIAIWAIATGVMEIVFAIQFRREIPNEGWLIVAGAASVIFGVLVVLFPRGGALGVIWIIGLFAMLYGILLIVVSLRLRNLRGPADAMAPRMT
jgi:uncharacterized membrane protein HdeD (DUF308 family)